MASTGRPTSYTPDLATEICHQLAEGETLLSITAKAEMPSYRAIMEWLDKYPDFAHNYARARDKQADFYADRVGDLSKEVLQNPKDSNAYRVAGDLLKWQAMIRAPRRYSERMHQVMEHTGGVAVSFTVAGLDDSAGSRQDVTLKP